MRSFDRFCLARYGDEVAWIVVHCEQASGPLANCNSKIEEHNIIYLHISIIETARILSRRLRST